jgi:hypothetical protein
VRLYTRAVIELGSEGVNGLLRSTLRSIRWAAVLVNAGAAAVTTRADNDKEEVFT